MFDTKSLCRELVCRSEVAASLSTSGVYDPRYLAANGGYLALVERVWNELEGQSLIEKGSALSTPDRDRRLWLLDRQGFYDCERAVIGVASGRKIEVEISAQRLWCSGQACDLEYFRPVLKAAAGPVPGPVASAATPRAAFLPEVESNLRQLSPLDRTILLRRMLTAVAEGAVMVARIRENRPVTHYADTLLNRFEPYICTANSTTLKTHFDVSRLDDIAAEQHLLEIAGEIWSLIRFARDQAIADMLQRLVAPYTQPGPIVVEG